MNVTDRYSTGMSEYSHFMGSVLNLKKKNDIVDLLRREGIYDNVSQKEVVFWVSLT